MNLNGVWTHFSDVPSRGVKNVEVKRVPMWREICAIVYQYIKFIGDQFLNLDLLQY